MVSWPPLSSLPINIFFLLFILPSASSTNFKIARFDATAANIVYEGDAVPAVGVIELIDKVNYVCRVGRATYAERVPLWDSHTGKVADFTTHFSFIVDTQGAANYGSGFAFFIAPFGSQIPPNSAGGFLGLFNTTTSDFAGNHIVLVEFDSFVNPEWDPAYQHVGINNNSIASVVNTPWNVSLHDGDTTDVWIAYNSTTTTLSVHWSYQNTPAAEETTSLSYQIDLTEVLPEWTAIGFSAGTSQYMERNKIVSWEFKSTLDRKYPGPSTGTHSKKMMMIIVTTLLAVSAVSLIVGMITAKNLGFCRSQLKKSEKEEEAAESVPAITATGNLAPFIEEISEGEAAPGRFTCQNIATATNNYSNDNKLGEGASGTVYKGDFTDINMTVAVKKISGRSDKGRKEYITEVNLISSLRHPNLVQLKGWCHDEGQTTFLLVYEYMPNGSLDSHLFGTRPPPTWSVRYKICKGLATALLYLHDAYLHEGWKQCVVHRDIKSSNILLDSSFNAKLGDFGLARIMYHEQDPKTTQLAGTFGYMDPEYIISGKASRESDVYSFGVVTLEIATGKKSVYHMGENSRKGLIQWVWDLYGQGNHFSAVDQRLHWNYDEKQVECLIFVGLWCAHPDKNQRPSIRQAIEYLNFDAELPRPPMRMPSAVYQVPVPLPSIISGASSSTTSLQVGR
ncbi:hypothetical protein ACLB2K_006244 [Fragaria x ananassa]